MPLRPSRVCLPLVLLAASVSALAPACSAGDEPSAAKSGVASGGSLSPSGGSLPIGGRASGGTSSGGRPSLGGTTSNGGAISTGTGGVSGEAGVGPTRTGGSSSTGGTPSSAGNSTSGGTASGGITSGGVTSGGSTASGGTAFGGGGGSTASGGTSTAGKGAPESKAIGYGRNATGAGSATPVVVNSFSAAQTAIDDYSGSGGLALRYTGQVNFAAIVDPCTQHDLPERILQIKEKNDITILGDDGSAADFGIHIASSSSNIVIRNMTFGLLAGGDASDAISIEGMSGGIPRDIWIDHNEFFSSMVECEGAGDTAFDGLIDLKKGADNVTLSYNHIHDHHKVSLNGFSDSDTEVRHVTYYRNIFQNVGSRTPLQRGGYSHVVNNLLSGITTSGVNVRMNGYSLIEGNFFEDVKNPVTSRDSDVLGDWELRNNNISGPADFGTFGITWSASDSSPTKDASDWTTTKAYPVALGYTYEAVSAQCVKDGLKNVAGSGKGLATLTCK